MIRQSFNANSPLAPSPAPANRELRLADLEARNQQLSRSNEDLAALVLGLSHDLKSPLNGLAHSLSYLGAEPFAQPAQAETITDARRLVGRMQVLVGDMLACARATMGAEQTTMERVDLRQVIDDIAADFATEIGIKAARISIGELPPIAGRPTPVRLLFQNLIENGLKFTRFQTPPQISIEMGNATRHGMVNIEVSDNGIGMDEGQMEKLFQPFERLHAYEDYEGTGLGLYLCKRIVGQHNGTISVRSTPGEGSVFIVSLPVWRDVSEDFLASQAGAVYAQASRAAVAPAAAAGSRQVAS